jgi:arsenate reductase-like glutaredoxin family protein
LKGLLGSRSVREVFSEKSPSVKKLGLDPAAMSEADMLSWIVKEPRLLKRPLLVVNGRLVVQPKPKDLDALFS